MATTLDVTPGPAEGKVLVEVQDDAADLPAGLAVERDDGKGYQARRYALVLDAPRHKVWADYECPTDTQVTYRIVGTGTTASITLASNGATWWKPLPYPSLGMPVDVLSYMEDGASETETVDVFPLGAEAPVTVYGARRMLAGTVVVGVWTQGNVSRFADGLRRSPIVLLQPPGTTPQVYLTIKGVQVRHPRRLASPERIYTMAAQVREAPVVEWSYPAGATWASYDTEATWAQWRDNGPTWLDVLLGDV